MEIEVGISGNLLFILLSNIINWKLFDVGWITCWVLLLLLIDEQAWYVILWFEGMCYLIFVLWIKELSCMMHGEELWGWKMTWIVIQRILMRLRLREKYSLCSWVKFPSWTRDCQPTVHKTGSEALSIAIDKTIISGILTLAKQGIITRWLTKEICSIVWNVRKEMS